MADGQERPCSVCEKPGVFLCSRCRDPYCSNQCQLNDWPQHKLTCFPIPHLIKSDVKPVVPQKLDTDLRVCLPKKRNTQLAPLRKPKISAIIETDEAAAAYDIERTKGYSFHNQFSRSQFYPGFQINDPLKSEENPTVHSQTKQIQLQNAENSALTENLLNDDFIDLKIGRRGRCKPENELRISGIKLRQTKIDQVSTEPFYTTSNIPEIPLMTTSEPLLEPKSKQVKAATSSTLNEIWRHPLPVEENVFFPVVVQFTTKDSQCVWVMFQNNETACNNLLRDINLNISTASNVQANEVEVNQLYLVEYEGIYYRGVSLELIRAGFVLVRLIDYGNEIKLPNDMFKEASPAIKNLNAFAFQIKFQRPRQVEIGDTLNIKIKSVSDGNVLNVVVETEENFATKADLEFIPIPIGVKTDLFVLDVSNINRGYVSACVNDVKATNHIEEMNKKISAYCKCTEDSYHPHVKELCLAKYEDDEWYRAVTLEVIDSETFNIMFIDYGSTTTIKSADIRKMSEEFMHNCLMNVCFIKGAPEKPTDDYIQKILSYFTENQVFSIESATKETDAFLIDIPELQV